MRKFYFSTLMLFFSLLVFSQAKDTAPPGSSLFTGTHTPQNTFEPYHNYVFQPTNGENVVYENGPFITHPGTPNYSRLQTDIGLDLYGFNISHTSGYSLADDMVLTEAVTIESIDFYGYQTGSSTTSTFTAIYVRIWNGAPNAGGTVIWGDLTTNVMESTGWYDTYRDIDTNIQNTDRPIMRITADLGGLELAAGTYWVEYSAAGSLSSGPWGPPITILGETNTGNALQYTGSAWQAALDLDYPKGIPFTVNSELNFPEPYCGPLAFPTVEPISRVIVADIDNPSDPTINGSPAHEDFTNTTGNMTTGESYPIALEGNTNGNFTTNFVVFIDWNQNGILNDPGEVYTMDNPLVNSNGTDGKQSLGTIVVPADALDGDTRMRVKKIFSTSNLTNPCLGSSYGQAEDYTINVTSGGGSGGDCGTLFTDTGGVDGNYGNSENITWTFNPDDPDNEVIVVTFTEFNVENNWDFLYVYDGPDTSAPLIASLTGTTIPSPITSSHPTGALTFNFISDGSVNRPGWVADVTCEASSGGGGDCTAVDVPYTQDFESAAVPDMPECTTIENAGSGNNWITYSGSSYGFTGTFLRYAWNATNPANAWFYTQGINLETNKTYKITYDYGGTSSVFPENLKVAMGTDNESNAMTVELADHPGVINSTPLTNEVEFTVSTNGVYYFGFNAYSEEDKFYLHVDNIHIEEVTGGGGTADPFECHQTVNSNNLEDGLFFGGATNQFLAVDIDILPESTFNIQEVIVNVAQDVTPGFFNIIIYDDAAGLPGAVLETYNSVSVTESTFLGANFGFDFYSYTLDIAGENLILDGGTTGTKYWMEIQSDAVAWEGRNNQALGLMGAFKNTNVGNLWTIGASEYVYSLVGECTGEVAPEPEPPVNDDCEDAIALECGDTHSGNTDLANNSGGNPAPDVFYSYTGNGTEELVTVSLCGSSFDTVLRIYSDCTLSNQIAFNDDFCGVQSQLSFISDGTSTYYIMVEGWSSNSGNYVIELTCESTEPVLNDDCDDAIALECGDTHSGNTTFATDSGGNAAPDVFYSYTGNGTEESVTVSLCDSSFDTVIRVYSDCSLTEQIAFNDDFCGVQSQVTFISDGVSTYYIMVEGWSNNAGEYVIELTCEEHIIPGCGDVFTDSGGVNGNYSNNENLVWTFLPENPGEVVSVIFTEFDLENNWDYLYVYDGDTMGSPLIATLTGTTIPGPFTSTHATGALTFNFVSDGSVNRAGWVADIVCAPFTAPNDDCDDAIAVSCGDTVTGSTEFATDSGMNPSPDVFYSYTGNGTPEMVTLSLCASNYDTFLRVFTACDLNEQIASNDDYCGIQSQLTFMSDGTSTYIIMIEGFGSQFGEYTLEVSCEEAPGCGDVFTDTGGESGNYGANEDIVWTFTPPSGEVVTIDFTSFDVEANWDALYIFDGPDTNAPLFDSGNPATGGGFPAGGYWGSENPGTFVSTHASGALTVRFLSDGSNQRAGWTANISCGTVSVEDQTIPGFAYYPNPMDNVLNISADTIIDQVIIYNVLGQVVHTQNINTTNTQLNVSNLASGSYLIKVTSENRVISKQLIKK